MRPPKFERLILKKRFVWLSVCCALGGLQGWLRRIILDANPGQDVLELPSASFGYQTPLLRSHRVLCRLELTFSSCPGYDQHVST